MCVYVIIFKLWHSHRLMLANGILLDKWCLGNLCHVYATNDLSHSVSEMLSGSEYKTHQKLAIFGFGEWETCPLRPLFTVCRICGEPLICL